MATEKGIAITNTPAANAYAVAEYALTLILAMNRRLFALGRAGDKSFLTANSLQSQKIGIIGFGAIARVLVQQLKHMGVKNIVYYSQTKKLVDEMMYGITFEPLESLLASSDIISIHTPKSAGCIIDSKMIDKTKNGAVLINCAHPFAIDFDALSKSIRNKKLRAAYDKPPNGDFADLSMDDFYCSNDNCAYNTTMANRLASDMTVQSLLNIHYKNQDQYIVNAEYKK